MKPSVFRQFLVLFLMLIGVNTQASDTLSVKVIALSIGDSIIVRWAPTDYKSWSYGITHGFKLERYTNISNGVILPLLDRHNSKVVLGELFLPLPEADWESLANQNELAGVAAGAIHGEGFLVDNLTETDVMTAYNVNRENETRFGFSLLAADQSLEIALAMGLGFVDDSVISGDEYSYKVTFIENGSDNSYEKGRVTISAGSEEGLEPPAKPKGIGGDLMAHLTWEKNQQQELYSSYYVEKSTDNGLTFSRVNDYPLISTGSDEADSDHVSFADSLEQNGVTYVYRIMGSTTFGILGSPSDTVHVIGKAAPIPVHPNIVEVVEQNQGSLNLNWAFDNAFNNQINGFNILRSNSRVGVFTKINNSLIGAATRNWTDTNPEGTNYYKIEANDINGHKKRSLAFLGQINDITPPSPPQNIVGEIDMNGYVLLNWDDNSETDLMGYRVYFKNQETGEFSQVTPHWVKTSSYVHQVTLNNLSETVYYKIRAVDKRHNISDFSEVCAATRPDIIAPSAPVITQADPIVDAVRLSWRASSSNDVVRHELQRKTEYEVEWTSLGTYEIGEEDFNLMDNPPSSSYVCEYRCLAFDEGDLVTSSKIIKVKPIDNGERDSIGTLSYNLDLGPQISQTPYSFQGSAGVCSISWDYPFLPGLHDFTIYRSLNGGPFRTYKTVLVEGGDVQPQQGSINTYTLDDDELKNGKTYSYKVKANFTDGGYSPISSPVSFGI